MAKHPVDDSGLPRDRLWQPTTARWFAVVFGACLAYAVLRYHVAGDVPLRHFPLYVLNKATALAAVAFVACSYLVGKVFRWHDDDKAMRLVVVKFCGLMGFFLAAAHTFMALCLLSPSYYAQFYDDDGKMSLVGEVSMLTGVLGLFFLLSPAIATIPGFAREVGGTRWRRGQSLGYLALLLVAVHLVAMGVKGWLTPSRWEGGLPPISLVALLVAATPLAVKWMRERDAKGS